MATALLKATVTGDWTDVIGAAAAQAGVTWQNVGRDDVLIAFTTIAPTASDGYHILAPGEAYYDKNGSAHLWAKNPGGSAAPSSLTATKD